MVTAGSRPTWELPSATARPTRRALAGALHRSARYPGQMHGSFTMVNLPGGAERIADAARVLRALDRDSR